MEIRDAQKQETMIVKRTAAVKDLPMVLGEGYGKVMAYLGENNVQPAGVPYVLYLNDNMEALEMEIGFPVSKKMTGNKNVISSSLPEGKQAAALHKGAYNTVEKTYNAIISFIKEQGKEVTGICYEAYLNDPQDTKPEDLLTEIVFPLKG